MARHSRRALVALAGIVVLLAVLAGGLAWVLLRTDYGATVLADQVNRQVADQLRIDGLDLDAFPTVRVAQVELLDPEGVWAVINGLVFQWRPGKLLGRQLAVDRIAADRVAVHRIPAPAGDAEAQDASIWPLPVDIQVAQVSLPEIRLAEAVAGLPATVALSAAGEVPRDGRRLNLEARVRRLDAPGEADLAARFDAREGRLSIEAAAREPAGGLVVGLLELPDAPPFELRLSGHGTLDRFDGFLATSAGEGLRLQSDVRARRDGEAVILEAIGQSDLAAALGDDLAPLLGRLQTFDVRARLRGDSLALERAALTTETAAVSVTGTVDLSQLSVALELTGDADLGAATAGQAEGAARFRVTAEGAASGLSGRYETTLELVALADLSLTGSYRTDAELRVMLDGQGTVSNLSQHGMPPRLDLEYALAIDPTDQLLTVSEVEVRAADALVTATGTVGFDGTAGLQLAGTVNRLAEWLPGAGIEGAVTVRADIIADAEEGISGPLAIELAGFSTGTPADALLGARPSLTAEVRATPAGAVAAQRIRLTGEAVRAEGDASFDGEKVAADLSISLSSLSRIAPEVAGAANASLSIDGPPQAPTIELTAEAPALKAAGLPPLRVTAGLSGGILRLQPEPRLTGKLRLAFAADDADARLSADLAADQQRVVLDGLAASGSGGLEAHGSATLELAAGTLQASLSGGFEELAPWAGLAGQDLSGALNFNLEGSQRALAFGAGVALSKPLSLQLTTAGSVELAEAGLALRLSRLEGEVLELPVALRQPLQARLGETISVEPFVLDIAEAQLRASGRLGPEAVRLQASFEASELANLARRYAGREVTGRLAAQVTLSGDPANPSGEATLALSDVRTGGAEGAGLPPIAVQAKASLADGRLNADASVGGIPGSTLTATGSVPVQVDLNAGQAGLAPDGSLSARLVAGSDLAALLPLLPLSGDRLAGRLDATVEIGGRPEAPSIAASGGLRDGLYENARTGALFTGLRFDLAGEDSRLRISGLSASDGDDGRIEGAAALDLAQAAVSATVRTAGFRAARIDELLALVDSDLRLEGPLNDLRLAGRIVVPRAEVEIPRRLPASVTELEVIEVNAGPPGRRAVPEPEPAVNGSAPAVGPDPALDLTLEIPGQLFVRGRGLVSEWQGSFTIAGRASAPQIDGTLQIVRGFFSLAGKRFELSRGVIRLVPQRDRTDAEVDLEARTSSGGIEAVIRVAGPVLSPEITLSSQPPMPQDEILSRVLFGKDVGSLSAVEALQLGQAAVEISGGLGAGGIMTDIRRAVGLDFLGVDAGGGTMESSRLSAGKYLAPNLYLGVRQGLTPESSAAVVEYELLPGVKLDSSVGSTAQSDIGVTLERRF